MKLLRSSGKKINKNKNSEKIPHLEITKIVLVPCNIVYNGYQRDARVLYTFVPNKSFGQLFDISPKNVFFFLVLIQNFFILKYGILIKILKR